MEGHVVIVGLGCVGSSIGLALRRHGEDMRVVGHDARSAHARQALKIGAVAKTFGNLRKACKGAGLVILALPLPQIRETLEMLGPHLPEGCVVTDTALLKMPVLEWAREFLPSSVHFATGVPLPGPAVDLGELLQGPEAARADFFEDGLYCITLAQGTDSDAGTVLSGLASLLGARQLFLDPLENDGLQSGVSGLPAIITLALLRTTVDSPGWREMRKVAGRDYAAYTALIADNDAALLGSEVYLNRENLIRRLDLFMQELSGIRRWLQEGQEESLQEGYQKSARDRGQWLEERAKGDWGEIPDVMGSLPTTGELAARLLVGGPMLRTLRKDKE